MHKTALVVTTIQHPTPQLIAFRDGCITNGVSLIVIGDTKSPNDFKLEGANYLDVAAQQALEFRFAALCPVRHYARKNIGYLVAMAAGCDCIVESDDDNAPLDAFWEHRTLVHRAHGIDGAGMVNAYKYFTEKLIWPRGLPLADVSRPAPALKDYTRKDVPCPIQQGLAQGNPDVDAIYRLTLPLPLDFNDGPSVALGERSWCPFNSQNTTWFPQAFRLMYLPSYCSFRMTDIWRSFVAQRIAWECGWNILFHNASVYQDRNEHDLMKDFEDEIPGYTKNNIICKTLENLSLFPGDKSTARNLITCYEALIDIGVVDEKELPLVMAWNADCDSLMSST